MASFRDHRVLIVSLFLPVTIAITGDDSSPAISDVPLPSVPPTQQLSTPSDTGVSTSPPSTNAADTSQSSTNPSSKIKPPPRLEGSLLSIVEDLRTKATSPLQTPKAEPHNPFATLAGVVAQVKAHFPSISPMYNDAPRPRSRSNQPKTDMLHPQSAETLGDRARRLSHTSSRSSAGFRRSSSVRRDFSPSSFLSFEPNPHANGGLINAVRSVEKQMHRGKLWIGLLSSHTDQFGSGWKTEITERLKAEHDSLPVFCPDSDFAGCYDVFCHHVLWPSLHYAVPDAPKTKVFYESSSFSQFLAVNQAFADAIVAAYLPGDIIWINDYHLMLVPRLVREKLPNAVIGFFLHVAFPSSEIFRCLAAREDLLRGMLGADIIGFQTHSFARHFRQTVSRILSLEASPKGIQLEHSFVDVAVFPIGIDVKNLSVKRSDPEVKEWVELLKNRYAGLKMIVARDKLDEIQGVRQKLLAFETFLEDNPEYRGKAVLLQVGLSTTESNELQAGVADVVTRINSHFSTLTYQPVVFLLTPELTFSQYLALLTIADAFMVTSLREGMALRAHEYVECQEEKKRPLIVSEFTGTYSYMGFRSCIPVNPWDRKKTAQAIAQSLSMSDAEAQARWNDLHGHVVTQTAQAFVSTFLNRCVRVHLEHQQLNPEVIPEFDVAVVRPRYLQSRKRLIVLDLDRMSLNLDSQHGPDEASGLPPNTLELLRKLSADPHNEVWAFSGQPIKGKLDDFATALPNVGFCAENGCFVKHSKSLEQTSSQRWMNMVSSLNLSWKHSCLEILSYFTERTTGSAIEERDASIAWRFWNRSSDNEPEKQWARRQAAEAQNHIWDSLGERYHLRIIPGSSSFLVMPQDISRTTTVNWILNQRNGSSGSELVIADQRDDTEVASSFDFILALEGDEELIQFLNSIRGAETCTISTKGSNAKWKMGPKDIHTKLCGLVDDKES